MVEVEVVDEATSGDQDVEEVEEEFHSKVKAVQQRLILNPKITDFIYMEY